MIWDWSYNLSLRLLIVKTSYVQSCYASNRHVQHRRSASRSWNLYAPRNHNYYHHYLLLCQRNRPWWFNIQLSPTNLQGTLILAWLMSSGSLAFWRTKHARLSLSRTIILRWWLTFWFNLWTTLLLEFALLKVFVFIKDFAKMKLGSEYLSCHVFEGTHRDQIRDQLPPVLDILADSLSDLKNTNFGILHFGILEKKNIF